MKTTVVCEPVIFLIVIRFIVNVKYLEISRNTKVKK